MAKKIKIDLGKSRPTDELDIPDFDFDFGADKIKDDRTPVQDFTKGLGRGVKDSFTSSKNWTNAMRKALPESAGMTLDVADQIASAGRSLYNDAANEIKPLLNESRKAAKKLLPTSEKFFPKKAADAIKRFAEGGGDTQLYDVDQAKREYENNAILQAQSEIFKFTTEQSEKNRAEDKADTAVQRGIDNKRYKDVFLQQENIRVAVQQNAEFQTKVVSKFMQKSLEVQYRQYFLMADLLNEQKKANAFAAERLTGILKNTGLPEFVKLKDAEFVKQTLRNKFVDAVDSTIFAKRREFMANLLKNVGSNIMGSVKSGISKAGDALAGVNTAIDVAEVQKSMSEMSGESGWVAGGEAVGSLGTDFLFDELAERYGGKLRSKLMKNKKVAKTNNSVMHFLRNLPQHAQKYSTSMSRGGVLGSLEDLLKNAIRQTNSVDNSFDTDRYGNMSEPAVFNRRTARSINEVIPGYLSYIHRELVMMRTGESADLMAFDHDKGGFSSRRDLASKIFGKVIDKGSIDQSKHLSNYLINSISGSDKLTKEQREILGRTLTQDNLKNGLSDPSRFSSTEMWRGEAAPHAETFSNLFYQHFKDDEVGDKRNQFDSYFQNLGSGITDVRAKVQELINDGHIGILEEIGLVKSSGNGYVLNEEMVNQYFGGKEFNPADIEKMVVQKMAAKRQKQSRDRAFSGFKPTVNKTYVRNETNNTTTTSGLTGGLDFTQVIAAVQAASSREAAEAIRDAVLRIEDRLDHGIPTMGSGVGDEQMGPPRPGKKGPWWNRSLRDVASGVTSAAWSGAKGAFNHLRDIQKRTSGIVDSAFGLGKKLGNWGVDRWQKLYDVYVEGEVEPRILAWKLRAGKYRDQVTGEVIRKFSDIKGTVVDEFGNVILEAKEMQNAFTKNGAVKTALIGLTKVKGILTKGMEFGGKVADALTGGLSGIARAAYGVGMKAYTGITKPIVDVYIKSRGLDKPVLLARKFRAGAYYSKKTGKVLERPDDIDGAVGEMIDGVENIQLTEEELKEGLVDRFGNPLVFGIGRLIGIGTSILGTGAALAWKGARKIGSALDSIMGKGFDLTNNFFKGIIGPDGIIFAGGKKMVKTLEQIRDILDDRLPGGKSKILGDTDGDGIRDNSAEDWNRKDAAKAKEKAEKGEAASYAGAGGMFGKAGIMGGLLGKLFGKKGGKDDDKKEDEKGGMFDSAKDIAGTYLATKLGMKGGIAAGAKSLLKNGAKFAGRLAPWAALGFGAKSAYDLATGQSESKLADGLGVGAGVLGGASILGALNGGGMLAGLGMIGSGLGTAAAAIGGVLASPAVLIGGAVAAAGYGAYKAYKYFTRKKIDITTKIRLAQYGILPDDKDHAQLLFDLEDKLWDAITISSDGLPTIDATKLKAKDLVESFGIDVQNDEQVTKWLTWFSERFKQVYLSHISVLYKIDGKGDLAKVDKLKPQEMKQYLEGVSMPGGPYGVTVSPFSDMDSLPANAQTVAAAVADAKDENAKSLPKDDTKKELAKESVTAAASGVGVAEAATAGKSEERDGTDNNDLVGGPKSADAAATAVMSSGMSAVMDSAVSGTAYTAVAEQTSDMVDSFTNGRVDASTAARYKTYGLTSLELDKVRALDKLEVALGPLVTYDSKGKAIWSGSIDAVLMQIGPSFGTSSSASSNGADFVAWFKMRFLPTYLNWATALYKKTGKMNPIDGSASLREVDALDVTMAVITSQSHYEGNALSVWNIPISPWPSYTLNSDVSSTDGNVAGMRELAKKALAKEETGGSGIQNDDDRRATAKALDNAGASPEGEKKGFWAKLFSSPDDKPGEKVGIFGKIKNAVANIGKMATDYGGGGGPAQGGMGAGMSGGTEITQPGNGTGGDINNIPKPTGNKSYAALKPTLDAAAKMVGVDPNLMGTMAAIESGFDYTVKAGSSSATGLFQFISGTWKTMMQKYAAKYGIDPSTPPTDPRANALMGAEFLKENMAAIKGAVNRPLTNTDLYIAHFMGAGGAKKFLSADPSTIGANMFPEAARANPSIFYKNGQPLTLGQIYQNFNALVNSKGKQFGVASGSDGSEAIANAGSAKLATGAPQPPAPQGAGDVAATGVAQSTPQGQTPAASSPDVSPDGSGRAVPTPTAKVAGGDLGVASGTGSAMPVASKTDVTRNASMNATPSPQLESINVTLQQSLASQLNTEKYMSQLVEMFASGLAGKFSSASSSSDRAQANAQPLPGMPGAPARPPVPLSMAKSRSGS